jgi:hypothetical protein
MRIKWSPLSAFFATPTAGSNAHTDYYFNFTIRGPMLSPVSSLCLTWLPSQYGNVFDFQHRQYTFLSSVCSKMVATFGDFKSMRLLTRLEPPLPHSIICSTKMCTIRKRKTGASAIACNVYMWCTMSEKKGINTICSLHFLFARKGPYCEPPLRKTMYQKDFFWHLLLTFSASIATSSSMLLGTGSALR